VSNSGRPSRKGSSGSNIFDVALLAGVSAMTVSNVMNGRGRVSSATKARVLEAVASVGYVADVAARSLSGAKTRTLGVLAHNLTTQFVGEVLRGAATAANSSGYQLLIATTPTPELEDLLASARALRTLFDGLILVHPWLHQVTREDWQALDLPMLVVQPQGLLSLPSISEAGARGAGLAMEHLVGLGHRRIGFVSGDPGLTADSVLEGYHQGLESAGIEFDPNLVACGGFYQQGGFRAAHMLLDLPGPPSAIFAANDLSAFGVLDAAQARNLRVPQDLSVVGYNDIPTASQVYPPLTTVRQPIYEMGYQAVELLLQMTRGGAVPPRTILPTELVVRATTAAPPTY